MRKMLRKQGGNQKSEHDEYLDGNVMNINDAKKVARNIHTTEKGT